MRKFLRFFAPAFAALAFCFQSAAVNWGQYPTTNAPGLSDTFLIGVFSGPGTNMQISAGNLRTWVLSADTTSIQASGSASIGQTLVVTGIDSQGRITVTGTNFPTGGSPLQVTNSSGGVMTSGVLTKGTGANGIGPATPGADYLTPSGNGSGLTSLNGSSIASGTVSVARIGTGGDGSGNHYYADDGTFKTVSSGSGGDMLKSDNLSGLANNATARANIGANDAGNVNAGTLNAARLPQITSIIHAITNMTGGSNVTVTATPAADGSVSISIQGITTSQFLTLALSLNMMTNGAALWTNTTFVANGLLYAGANKQVLSVNVGAGAVTNDGAGGWGATPLRDSSGLANSSFAYADSSGHIVSGYDGGSLSNLIGGSIVSGDSTITVTPTRITTAGPNLGSTNYALHATGGGGGALGYTNYYARTTNALVFDASVNQTASIGLLTNSTLIISNANYLTNVSAQSFQINYHQDTNGFRTIPAILVSGGLLRTNGAFTLTTNANATDILIGRLDGTRTNVVLSFQTNVSSYVDTNSLATGGGGGGGSTSYANNGGTGDRQSIITMGGTTISGPVQQLVDGLENNTSPFITGGVADGATITVTFNSGSSAYFDEFTFVQSTTSSHGVWKWQCSDNGSSWTDIGSSFTFSGSVAGAVNAQPAGASTPHRYWQMVKVSGSTDSGPVSQEFKFKISTGL